MWRLGPCDALIPGKKRYGGFHYSNDRGKGTLTIQSVARYSSAPKAVDLLTCSDVLVIPFGGLFGRNPEASLATLAS